jgi:FAD/FMN-containing dehydrogenase
VRLVAPGDEGFDEAAYGRIFNARKPAAAPAAVLFAVSEQDVVAGVRLARERGWGVAVRSGGHSWAGWSVREGALLIDLGGLHSLSLDGDVCVASPSTQGGLELTPFLAARGRTFTAGHCEGVGLGGFLLQGGQGWNSRRWGWGCENVLAVDVVTADGSLVRGDEELLWAARGAGPAFPGVITRLHLRTYAAEPMFHDTRTFALAALEPLLHWLHELLPALDVRVEPVLAASRLGGGETALLLHTTVTAPSSEDAARLLAPLDAAPPAVVHERGPTSIVEENVAMTLQNPYFHRYAADSQWTDAGAAELYPRLKDIYASLPTEHSFSIWYGWAPSRELPDMAFSLERNVYLATYAIWTDPADDERHRSWVHGHTARLAEVGDGVYVGDSDFTRRPDRHLAPENARRLAAIRAARDPDDVFGSPWR